MSTFSGFSTNTPEPAASPQPALTSREFPAEPQEMPERPRDMSRREMFQRYMRQYASGQIGSRAAKDAEKRGPPAQGETGAGWEMEGIEAVQHAADRVFNPIQAQAQTTAEDAAYTSFLASAQHRALQRHDLATRDVIFSETLARARTRLQQVEEEKTALEGKVVRIERERERYRVEHAVGVSEVEDQREARRWEEWFRVSRGVQVGVGEGQGRGEGLEGGVDI